MSNIENTSIQVQISKETIRDLTQVSFIQQGMNFFTHTKGSTPPIHDKLPAGNYLVKFSLKTGFFLEMTSPFPEMGRIYGETPALASRILNTYQSKKGNLGVLLDGLKGSGKTLLARLISIQGANAGIPTLVINEAVVGEQFFQFLYSIQQECIILFDEFEKVFNDEQQQSLLTVLDGTFPSKKLFLLTSNDLSKINQHLRNRPGRIHYHLNFKGLSHQFVKEYAEDNLKNKDHMNDLISVCSLFSSLNFDSLSALIWEMNLYNEPAGKAIAMLNTKPESDAVTRFEPVIIHPAFQKPITSHLLSNSTLNINPINFHCHFEIRVPLNISVLNSELGGINEGAFNAKLFRELSSYYEEVRKNPETKTSYEQENAVSDKYPEFSFNNVFINGKPTLSVALSDILESDIFTFTQKDVHSINADTGEFVYKTKDNVVLVLTKVAERTVDYTSYLSAV